MSFVSCLATRCATLPRNASHAARHQERFVGPEDFHAWTRRIHRAHRGDHGHQCAGGRHHAARPAADRCKPRRSVGKPRPVRHHCLSARVWRFAALLWPLERPLRPQAAAVRRARHLYSGSSGSGHRHRFHDAYHPACLAGAWRCCHARDRRIRRSRQVRRASDGRGHVTRHDGFHDPARRCARNRPAHHAFRRMAPDLSVDGLHGICHRYLGVSSPARNSACYQPAPADGQERDWRFRHRSFEPRRPVLYARHLVHSRRAVRLYQLGSADFRRHLQARRLVPIGFRCRRHDAGARLVHELAPGRSLRYAANFPDHVAGLHQLQPFVDGTFGHDGRPCSLPDPDGDLHDHHVLVQPRDRQFQRTGDGAARRSCRNGLLRSGLCSNGDRCGIGRDYRSGL